MFDVEKSAVGEFVVSEYMLSYLCTVLNWIVFESLLYGEKCCLCFLWRFISSSTEALLFSADLLCDFFCPCFGLHARPDAPGTLFCIAPFHLMILSVVDSVLIIIL